MGLLLMVALGLAACSTEGAIQATEASTSGGGVDAAAEAVTGIALTDEMALMLGTMKLDDVGLAPDAGQASELLLLWQAYLSLATSDTAAGQVEAV
jgi:hypothetical protein